MRPLLPSFALALLLAPLTAVALGAQAPPEEPPKPTATTAAPTPIARGDAAFARRAEGHQGGRAAAGPIDEAIAAYEQAVRERPEDLDGYWKLLRALHFKGEYVVASAAQKQEVFGRGRAVAEKALDLLARRAGGRARLDKLSAAATAKAFAGVPQAVPIYLWGGVDWGLWGDAFGKMAAARKGVGDRLRHYGEVVVAMDERFEHAGGHRLLGRLHTLAPKIPFITGWVDRDKAVSELRRAVELGPEDPTNHLYLAEALLEHHPDRHAEAVDILRRTAARQPSPERVVEEDKILAEARAQLAQQRP